MKHELIVIVTPIFSSFLFENLKNFFFLITKLNLIYFSNT